MEWQDICDDKLLQDLSYKVELNQWGQIVMSPRKINILRQGHRKSGFAIASATSLFSIKRNN
ncbi:hypothetical protein NIES208_09500 [[Limnothrix rosea] IAM M-220]|nr:hypothetical protein NIES208_09500 [[Limnothrix rosea] IAM M-220]